MSVDKRHAGEWRAWTHAWWMAAQRQANRIQQEPGLENAPDKLMYVDALRNVLRGAMRVLGEDDEAVHVFNGAVPGIVDARNMLDHFDEYVEGKGRRQSLAGDPFIAMFSGSGADWQEIAVGETVIQVVSSRQAAAKLIDAVMDAASIKPVSAPRPEERN